MTATNPQPHRTGMTSEKLRETPGAKAAESAPRRQKTAKFDRKLVEILRTAASVFAEVGYDPASIRMVADRAGVSVAGLYYYVRSKDELLYLIQYHVFDGLVRRFASDSAQMLADGGEAARPQARLQRFIHNHLDHFLADMASLTVCTRELGRLDGEYLQQVETLQRAYFHQAFEIFQELCSARDDSRMDPRTATLAMFGTINWVSSWYDEASDTPASELAGEFAKLYLRGVSPTDGYSPETFKGAAGRVPGSDGPPPKRKGRGKQ
jgi:TetR/AcrR family transcriptional regulator, cholesterol catabolism regulator